ncbi:MAG TPA: heavy-metal-associated domain-containing protein [Lysobacter sp.]|nr:heavy-metal-associated domain-containing protein [Lysobacter sp.]
MTRVKATRDGLCDPAVPCLDPFQGQAINQRECQAMLLDIEKITCDNCSDAIQKAIVTQDPTAQVTVNVADKQVRVEGLLTQQQAIDALAAAGYPATNAAPHSGEGSDCCGGCS